MPTTRSHAADEKVMMRTYEDSPASPSENAPASTTNPRSTEPSRTERTKPTATEPIAKPPHAATSRPTAETTTIERRIRAPSVRSQHSTASAIARIKQAELEAEEQLAEIRRQELRIQAMLIKKKLAVDVATIREETDRESIGAEEAEDTDRRISEWLKRSQIRGEHERVTTEPKGTERHPQVDTPNRVIFDTSRRQRSPTPGRSRERGIERLADTIEKMTRSRMPSRQMQELPLFTGAVGEWLPFKAAMRESSALYGFTPAENLARLRTCLRGEARQTVAALLYTATEPATIMKTLEQCFGRPEIIIDQALDDIKKLPRLGTTAGELNGFAIKLQNIVTVMTCVDEKGYLQNPMLARQVTDKLSPHIKSKWCDYAEEYGQQDDPEIITLSRFLMREADRAVRHSYSSTTLPGATRTVAEKEETRRGTERRRRANVYATNNDTFKRNACLCCGGEHPTPRCKKIESMSVPKRWEWAKETQVCFLCLNNRHRRMKCRAKRCGTDECRMSHHALLHAVREEPRETTATEETVVTATTHLPSQEKEVLLKICPVTVRGHSGKEIETYALLDEGSTISLIDREICNKIGARGPTQPLNIFGVTTNQREPESQAVEIRARGRGQTEYHRVKARTVKNLTLGHQSIKAEHIKYAHLRTIKPESMCYGGAKPRILIGADQWHLIVTRKLLTGKNNQPAASLTRLGWVIHGSAPRRVVSNKNDRVLHVRGQNEAQPKDELCELVESHFRIDALGIEKKRKPIAAEERAVTIFERTARRVNGQFEVGLPWRTDDLKMPPSYSMALKRLHGLEKKMDRAPQFKVEYTAQINQLLEKGYARLCDENHDNDQRLWHLPHFAATNPNKPGKIRLVFDAAAKTDGTCLNDFLLDGPDLLQTLNGVLFRFRMKPIAVTADIREMFLRIKIREEDQGVQHFLWRGDRRTGAPQRYVMTSMIFGARSSPFLAHSVRNKNATDHRESHPLAYDAITTNHYMDDWLESFDTREAAAQAIEQVTEVHGRAGFELAGWSTNYPRLIEHIPAANKAQRPRELGAKANTYEKALGVIWLSGTDELAFNINMPRVPDDVRTGDRIPTKREALSAVMSIFDPLGLLSPYTITAKIMLQGLWRKRIGWDDPLPHEEATMFEEWHADLALIKDLRLPRCYEEKGRAVKQRQLHVLCDASEQAYAAVAYWRMVRTDGSIRIAIVAGKAKVAPMKAQSIPRMELQAGLIGARLAAGIIKEHRTDAEIILWSDSKTVLHWIRNESSRYTPYVAHRLSEIAELTQPNQWRWLPTGQNVADDATRAGKTQLKSNDRWFEGPPFLYTAESNWPQEEREIHDQEEIVTHATNHSAWIDMSRFSSYERLIRTVANVVLFADKCRRRATELELRHVKEAETLLTRESQKESFQAEIERLKQGKGVDRTSRLYRLDPKYGNDGIIRLNGRINAATVPDELKEPPILDGAHPLVRLRIQREHRNGCHMGREQTVNTIRQQWWVLRLRPAVRTVINNCVICRTSKARPRIPVKGNLPPARLTAYSRPFTQCGVDCFGPMWVTIGRRREKRWGMLFTCLVTLAIHIEIIAGLSNDSAIMALRRMAARRGWPERIISDNATNFRGSATELKEAYKEWLPHLRDYGLTKRIDWRYIDPGAPNQGGAWERLIRSVKTALATTLHERSPREEVLATVLAEIEHTVNSRPLTHVPVDPNDPEALTPNHFLLGTAVGVPCVGECNQADRKTWRVAQAMANMFWGRWMREYLPTLVPRDDVRKSSRNPQVGDVVIIADGSLPRNTWPRGQITNVYAGPDGVVRSVDVHTKGGTFRRPTRRLIVLRESEGCEDLRRGENVADVED